MKKIAACSLIFLLFSVAVSAQRGPLKSHRNCNHGQITRAERFDLRKDAFRLGMAERRVHRDGVVTPTERFKMNRAKRGLRREAFIYRHNDRRRVI